MVEHSKLHCSFCGKPASDVKKLIAGPDVYICNECTEKCAAILKDGQSQTTVVAEPTIEKTIPSPSRIKAFLDQYVVGQDYAKEILSVAVYNHLKRIDNPVIDGVEISKANCLVLGPSGVGKTALAQTIARYLDVPFAIADATALTEAGYVGEDVESIVARLLAAADNDVKKAERGIIFIDEIDKKKQTSGGGSTRDVSGEGVQQALLKILEGSDVMVAPVGLRKTPNMEMIKVNTRNILFIVAGAFTGLDKIVERSLAKGSKIGFGAENVVKTKSTCIETLMKIEPDHLVEFGLIPELVGRLPIIAPLSDLDEAELVRVLTEPKNSLIKQFTAMFRVEGIELEFSSDALTAIAKNAKARKTNGRALRSVLETTLMKTQFRLPDLRDQGASKIIVGLSAITGGEPKVIFEKTIQQNNI